MSRAARPGPLRRTRADLIVAGLLTILAALALGGAFFSAPIRGVAHSPAAAPPPVAEPPTEVPGSLTPVFDLFDTPVPGRHTPLVTDGVLIVADGHSLSGRAPTGEELWSYSRPEEICSLGAAWKKVVVAYRTGVGCGDVVALHAATGEYAGTRSAPASAAPAALSSNDRVGTVGPDRVELWRSDLVRTVEYGAVEAKQEPNFQPHEECTITSALTRTTLLAVTEVCPEDPSATWLRFQAATPEDSRAPEISGEQRLDTPAARLVAIGEDAAAVYLPGDAPLLLSVAVDGTEHGRQSVTPAPAMSGEQFPSQPATADLPHHMSWFDGERLYLLTPETLLAHHVLEDAIGTGVAVAERLLYPTAAGVTVLRWDTGEVDGVIPVDRAGYEGPVFLELVGQTLLERRGEQVIGLRDLP